MASQHPQVGAWYLHDIEEVKFEVVAIDEDFATIEIQFENGDIDEIELEFWDNEKFLPSSAPDNALGAYGMSSDDLWDDDPTEDSMTIETESNRFSLDAYQDFDDFI